MQPISFKKLRKNRFAKYLEEKEERTKNKKKLSFQPVPVPAPVIQIKHYPVFRRPPRHFRRPRRFRRRRRRVLRRTCYTDDLPWLDFSNCVGPVLGRVFAEDYPEDLWKRSVTRKDKTFRKRWCNKETGHRGRRAGRFGIKAKLHRRSRTLCRRQDRAAKLSRHFQF
jgi:hypothetical protein